jgi:homoserine O-acetyltransferase/O-succinyltransferase
MPVDIGVSFKFLRPISTAAMAVSAFTLLAAASAEAPATPATQFAALGTCALDSGEAIHDCKLGYLTLGKLNSARDNAILLPTWYGGKSQDLLKYLGPGRLIDTDRHFVIVLDNFGNGVSSSPSNSAAQAGAAFPAVSMRDMVRHQKRFVDEHLKLPRLHAVVGISMGGMQAIEWAVVHPDAARRFIAIAGSPRLAPYDIVFWETHQRLIQSLIDCQCQRPMAILAGMRFLMKGPEAQAASGVSSDAAREAISGSRMSPAVAHDRLLQINAMIGHDVAKDFGGDLARAASRAGTKLLLFAATKDTIVTPGPARAFGKLTGNAAIELAECDHDIPQCGGAMINPIVRDFLSR